MTPVKKLPELMPTIKACHQAGIKAESAPRKIRKLTPETEEPHENRPSHSGGNPEKRGRQKLRIKRILLILLAALLLLHLAVSNWYLPLSEDNIRSRDNSLLTHSPFSGRLFQLDPDNVAGAAVNYAILESREDMERFCQALNSFRYFRVEKMKTDIESIRRDSIGGGTGFAIYGMENQAGQRDVVGFSPRPVKLLGVNVPGLYKLPVKGYWYYTWDPLLFWRLEDPFRGISATRRKFGQPTPWD